MKKNKNYIDINASISNRDKYFGIIYEGMCKSEQFQKLSRKAQIVYVLCRVHAHTQKCKACLYNHAKEEGRTYGPDCFVFPDCQQDDYGEHDHSNFNKYMKQLINAGFIDLIENNKHRFKINVYSFSSKWKSGC